MPNFDPIFTILFNFMYKATTAQVSLYTYTQLKFQDPSTAIIAEERRKPYTASTICKKAIL